MTDAVKRVRQVERVHLAICVNGHAEVVPHYTHERAWEVTCKRCGGWTWEDGNYCVRCGTQLEHQDRKPMS